MPPPQDNARVVFLIILILWLNAGPNEGPGLLSAPALIAARLSRQRDALAVLNQTRWGDFAPRQPDDGPGTAGHYLNLTGFRQSDGFAWEDLGRFRTRCAEWSASTAPTNNPDDAWEPGIAEPTWQNATGKVHGAWVRRAGSVARTAAGYNLSDVTPDVSWANPGSQQWSRNVTGPQGKMILQVEDEKQDAELRYEEAPSEGEARTGGLVRAVSAEVTIEDTTGTGGTHDMRLHGVHWPRQGVLLLTTTSEKFAGVFALPHLAPGRAYFESSRKLLNRTLNETLRAKEKSRFSDSRNPWSVSPDTPQETWNPSPHCEYIMYVQVHPLNVHQMRILPIGWKSKERQAALIREIEDELRYPTGRPIRGVPDLQMSAVLYSPDCGYLLETKGPPTYPPAAGQHLLGKKEEVFEYHAKLWLLMWAAVLFGQVRLLQRQMRESYTPSTLGRVSFHTGGAMLLADGMTFAASSGWSLSSSTTFLPSLMVTFAAFLAMTIGGSFLAEVYRAQEPERRNREREQQNSSSGASRPSSTPAPAGDLLPRPATAGRPRVAPARTVLRPVIIPSDQDVDAEIAENMAAEATAAAAGSATANPSEATTFSTIAGRFVMSGIFLLILSLTATSWWPPVRSAYINTLAFVYLSLWAPQIWRNIQRNSRRAFSWRFMIGQSALRLCPLAYFYLREDNVLFAEPDWTAFAVLTGWVWTQLWILAFQDALGPRFGIPKRWTPEAWDYHPVLREDGLESGGLPIGLVSGSAPGSPSLERTRTGSQGDVDRGRDGGDKKAHTRSIDCAICREVLEVPVVRAGDDDTSAGGVAGLLARRLYMVTPCRHIFHSACLEGWLRFRLQCPICREDLPPL